MLFETITRIGQKDPARVNWCVQDQEIVWVDASSLATGVALEVDRDIDEDACWLHPNGDTQHINLAELNAVLRDVNLSPNGLSMYTPVDL